MRNKFKIYYINMNRSKQRQQFMEKQLSQSDIDYIRVTAIDGNELNPEIINYIKDTLIQKNEHYTLPKVGEIGVYYSHYKVWEQILLQKEEFALVLEDDALLDMKRIDEFNKLCNAIESSEIINISGMKGFLPLEQKQVDNITLTEYSTPPLRALGNIIGKKAAQKLVNTFPSYSVPVDNMIQQIYKHQIKIWVTSHAYVNINDKELGGSTIQIKNEDRKEKIRKEIIRPLYRLKVILLNLNKRFLE